MTAYLRSNFTWPTPGLVHSTGSSRYLQAIWTRQNNNQDMNASKYDSAVYHKIMLIWTILAGFPALIIFPIMHPFHAICTRSMIAITTWCPPPVKQYITMHRNKECIADIPVQTFSVVIPKCQERKNRTYSNVLGARRRQKKEREAEEDMAKYYQRRPTSPRST